MQINSDTKNTKNAINAPFQFNIKPPAFRSKVYNVLNYMDKSLSVRGFTDAIQTAINNCAEEGGGVVLVPKGKYLTKKIHLKSNIHLKFEEGAQLYFSDNPSDYLPAVFTRWEGIECYNYSPLIYANNCENIKISGEGLMYGNGENWWKMKKHQGQT